jgi:hypothetical protein
MPYIGPGTKAYTLEHLAELVDIAGRNPVKDGTSHIQARLRTDKLIRCEFGRWKLSKVGKKTLNILCRSIPGITEKIKARKG